MLLLVNRQHQRRAVWVNRVAADSGKRKKNNFENAMFERFSARRPNQSILKEISPECSLEGLMLKLKLRYFDHLSWLIWKDPDAGKDWGQEEKATTEDEMVGWYHQLLESTQTHVNLVSDTIQPSHPVSLPSPPALNLSQHQGLFQWVSYSHQVAKVLQLQHQSFQWVFTGLAGVSLQSEGFLTVISLAPQFESITQPS